MKKTKGQKAKEKIEKRIKPMWNGMWRDGPRERCTSEMTPPIFNDIIRWKLDRVEELRPNIKFVLHHGTKKTKFRAKLKYRLKVCVFLRNKKKRFNSELEPDRKIILL